MNSEILRTLPQRLARPIVPAAVGLLAVVGGLVVGGITKSEAEKATNNSTPVTSRDLNNKIPNQPLQLVTAGLILIVLSIGLDNLQQSRKEQ